jgi:hypothetical protein
VKKLASEKIYRNMIPRVIIAVVAWIYLLDRLTTIQFLGAWRKELTLWGTVIYYWSMMPPIFSSLVYQFRRISSNREKRNKAFWKASMIVVTFVIFLAIAYSGPGAAFPMNPNTKTTLYKNIYLFGVAVATQGIWYIMLTGYTLEAAYRSMKLTSLDAVAFLIPCFAWMGRGMPIIGVIWPGIFNVGYWFMGVVNYGGTVGPTIAALLTSVIFAARALVVREKGAIMEV